MPVVFLGKSRERVCVTDLRARMQSKWSSPGTGWGERQRTFTMERRNQRESLWGVMEPEFPFN